MTNIVGIFLVALSAAGFGTLAFFGRYAYADGMDTLTILFLRFSPAAMLSTLEPVVTVLLASICLSETLSPLIWIGGGLILTAVILQTRGELRRTQPGLMLGSNHG